MITDARKEYMRSAGHDVAASVLVQLVTLFAILLAANFATLGSAAKLTLALSIAGPIYLLASMALTERIIASADGYTNFYEIAISRLLLLLVAFLVTGVVFSVVWGNKLATEDLVSILCLVGGARLVDCVTDTAIQLHRRGRRFRSVFELAALNLIVFLFAFVVLYKAVNMDAALASGWAMFLAALPVAVRASISLPLVERVWPDDVIAMSMAFIIANGQRGSAQLINSLQGNVPRLVLEVVSGPQSQAAFTILSSVARAGTIVLQSGFVPVLPRYAALYAREPLRALVVSFSSFTMVTLALGLGLAFSWWLGWRFSLIHLLGRDLQSYISFEAGLCVLIGVTLYMLRFAMWQVYGLIGSGDKLFTYAAAGLITTTLASVILVPHIGILGAAIADAIGSLMLIGWPLYFLRKQAV